MGNFKLFFLKDKNDLQLNPYFSIQRIPYLDQILMSFFNR